MQFAGWSLSAPKPDFSLDPIKLRIAFLKVIGVKGLICLLKSRKQLLQPHRSVCIPISCEAFSESETWTALATGGFFKRGYGLEGIMGEGETLSSESMERPLEIDDIVLGGGECISTFKDERRTKLTDCFFIGATGCS